MYIGIFIAFLAGIFISVQGSINGMVGNNSSVNAVISIPVAVQFLIYMLIVAFNSGFRRDIVGIVDYKNGIFYLVIAAILGIGIMLTLTISFMKVGPLLALSIVVFSQLMVSMVIEHFGFFGNAVKTISISRVMGLMMMILGVVLFSRK